MVKDPVLGKHKRSRSVILFQITALVVIVFIISGVLSVMVFQHSEGRLVEKSKQKLIRSEAELICSGHSFISDLIVQISFLKGASPTDPEGQQAMAEELSEAIAREEISSFQKMTNDILKDMVASNIMGITLDIEANPPAPPIMPDSLILFSSDENYIYHELPAELVELIQMPEGVEEPYRARLDEYNSYMLAEDGIPEMDLDGGYLVTSYLFEIIPGSTLWFFDFKPMDKELADIESFYSNERNRTNLMLALVIGGSIILLILITFFVLSFLIRKRITGPIDELSAAATMVMEGDLDVEVEIRKGEEFRELKEAFNNMIRTIRDIISRSAGG
ncbi:MAG: HAMP domain-containing protein [Actinobacteria bacterium]|nr:HAMP domain-containing protein [Actinomycetota bacterium]